MYPPNSDLLRYRYDDRGALSALSGSVGLPDDNSTMRATAPPPALVPERAPKASSRARRMADSRESLSPLWPRNRTSMLVARCRCDVVNRRSPANYAKSPLVKQCAGCTTPDEQANMSSDLGMKYINK